MELENQVSSFEQSKKLKELGIVYSATPSATWNELKYPANENGDYAENRAHCLRTDTDDNLGRFIMHYIDNEEASYHWWEGTHDGGLDHSRCELDSEDYPAFTVGELGILLELTPEGTLPDKHKTEQIKQWYAENTNVYKSEAALRTDLFIYMIETGHLTIGKINKKLR